MSRAEYELFNMGGIMKNNTVHSELRGTASTSVGFTYGIGGEREALQASRRLRCIVTAEYLLVATIDETFFTKSQGRYKSYLDKDGNPVEDSFQSESAYFDEYCRTVVRKKYFTNIEWHRVTGLNPFPPHQFFIDHGETSLGFGGPLPRIARQYLRIANGYAAENRDVLELENYKIIQVNYKGEFEKEIKNAEEGRYYPGGKVVL